MTVIDNSDVFGLEGDVRLSEAGPRDFFALLKPRVMSLVVFTALAGLLVGTAAFVIAPKAGMSSMPPSWPCPSPNMA